MATTIIRPERTFVWILAGVVVASLGLLIEATVAPREPELRPVWLGLLITCVIWLLKKRTLELEINDEKIVLRRFMRDPVEVDRSSAAGFVIRKDGLCIVDERGSGLLTIGLIEFGDHRLVLRGLAFLGDPTQ